jgi:hypothetical protein
MATSSLDRETILRAFDELSADEQLRLAQEIRQRLSGHTPSLPQQPSWRQMVNLASNGQLAPSDEQVAQWLDEHRTEKYGNSR